MSTVRASAPSASIFPGATTIQPEGVTPKPDRRYTTEFRYTDRDGKARYVAIKYAPLLTGSVLDVGCDRARLRTHLSDAVRYTGVDRSRDGGADVAVDLDRDELPFEPASFDTVLCTDVLEHLERCHDVFDQLCRAARRHVIVSLPNPLRNMLESLVVGRAAVKYYGLPVEAPGDRHRWFFGFEDAVRFVSERGRRAGFSVEQLDFEHQAQLSWPAPAGADIFAHPSVRPGTMWCVLRRDPGPGESR
ncbi:MAG: methyltransferase domain-containing protein [Phycisphaerae bacterium]|nr:methyltransferase domain-containing protein [Phycisphaerae bacterium]